MFGHLNRIQLENAHQLLIDDRVHDRSKTLIDAYDFRTVVYVVFLVSLEDGSVLIKIGSTKRIGKRLERISSTYGVNAAVMDIYPCERHSDFETFVQQSKLMRPILYTDPINNKTTSREVFRLKTMKDYPQVKRFMKKSVFPYEKDDIRRMILQVRDKELNNERMILNLLEGVPEDQKVEMIRLMFPTKKLKVENTDLATDTPTFSDQEDIEVASEPSSSSEIPPETTEIASQPTLPSIILSEDIGSSSPDNSATQETKTVDQTIVRLYLPTDLATVVHEYNGILEAARRFSEYTTTKPGYSSVQTHVRNCTIYHGYRWQTISSLDGPTPLAPTAPLQSRISDVIVELSEHPTTIIHPVYLTQPAAADHAGVSASAVCTALSHNRKTGGKGLPKRLFKRWNDVDITVREAYLENHTLPDPNPPSRSTKILRIRDGDERPEEWGSFELLRSEESVTSNTVKTSARTGVPAKDGWRYWFPEDE